MMDYQDYILLIGRLSRHSIARLTVGAREIVIEKSLTHWKLSTQIFQCDGSVPSHVEECVWSAALLKWKEKILLTLDPLTSSVHLLQEVDPSHFPAFKSQISQFLSLADEWQDIVAGFATSTNEPKSWVLASSDSH